MQKLGEGETDNSFKLGGPETKIGIFGTIKDLFPKKVEEYKKMIKEGKVPFLLLLNIHEKIPKFYHDMGKIYFVLDGHHKGKAYYDLKRSYPSIIVRKLFKNQ